MKNFNITIKQGVYIALSIIGLTLFNSCGSAVNPCDCAEIGPITQMIGYNNLSDEQKTTFDNCSSKYSTTSEAYEDCVNKLSNELK